MATNSKARTNADRKTRPAAAKPAARKPAARKSAAKPAAKRTASKAAPARKPAAKRTAASKAAPARKPAIAKAVPKRATAKAATQRTAAKAAPKRATAKTTPKRGTPAKGAVKPAARATTAKRGAAKPAAKRVSAAKAAPKRATATKAAPKGPAVKAAKAAPKRGTPAKAAAKPVARATAAKRGAAKPPAKRATAAKAAPKRATVTKAAPKRATTAKRPTAKAAPKRTAGAKAAPKASVRAAAPKRAPAKRALPMRGITGRMAARKPPVAEERVGFIGLGTMGLPQALNLAKSGKSVLVYDANPAAMREAAKQANVEVAESPRALAERCQVILTCLPDDSAVNAVFRGEAGMMPVLRAGTVTCDLSTVSPEFTDALDAELRAKGVHHFTGPMLGSKPQAEAGQVFYMLGGQRAHLDRITPYLELAGRKYIYVGPAATANKVKLLHNALGAVNYAAVAEALALCAQNGVNLQTFYEVVRNGGGMAFGNYFDRKVPTIIKGDFSPRFKLKLAHKDSQLAKAFFAGTGVPTPIHDAARGLLEEALAAGYGEDDASAVTRIVERRIGRPIRQD